MDGSIAAYFLTEELERCYNFSVVVVEYLIVVFAHL